MCIGAALACLLGVLRGGRARRRQTVLFAALCLPMAVFFAHLFYCVMRLEYVVGELSPWYCLAFWENGHMLYGGMAGCGLAAWLLTRKGGLKAGALMDVFAPSGALMIAFIRIAEGLAGQGYGEYLMEDQTFAFFPFAVYDGYYEAWAWSLFLLEALWALFLCLYLLTGRRRGEAGTETLTFLGLYGAAQILFESLRRDDFLRWGFVRCSQVLSAVLVFAVLLVFCLRAGKGGAFKKWLCWLGYAACILLCLLLEFATEDRIPFLSFLSVEGCYAVMACACGVL